MDFCKKLTAVMTVLCMLILVLPFSADAELTDGSITLMCRTEDTILAGMEWKIYKVAERNPYLDQIMNAYQQGNYAEDPTAAKPNTYRTVGDFEGSPVMLDNDKMVLATAAVTLENEAILRHYTPLATAYTDETGEVNFENLREGLYLLSGKRIKINDKTYVPTAMMVEVMDNEEFSHYNIDAFPKVELRTLAGKETVYSVRKIWQNDEYYLWDRSTQIIVNVYKDGEFFDKAILNEENNWTASWEGKDDCEWRVEEVEIPAKYTVVYLSDETQFVVENTYNPWYDSSSANDEWGWAVTTTTPSTTTTAEKVESKSTTTTKNGGSGHSTTAETLTSTSSNSKESGKLTETGKTTTKTGSETIPKNTTNSNSESFSEHSGNSSETQTTTVTTVTTTKPSGNGNGSGGNGSGSSSNSGGSSGNGNGSGSNSSSGGGFSGGNSGKSGGSSSGNNSSISKLPQTGQLWLPVPFLALGGIIFLMIGWKTRRQEEQE